MIYFEYFIIGFILNVLSTLDVRAVLLDRAFMSANVDLIGGILWYFIIVDIVLSPDRIWLILAYLAGGYVGTIFTFKSKIFKGKKFNEKENN